MEINCFDWDENNLRKCQKHSISKSDIETIFFGRFVMRPDIKHSHDESRYWIFGESSELKIMIVVFTLRIINGQFAIQPFSARYLNKKELKRYEKEITKIQNR